MGHFIRHVAGSEPRTHRGGGKAAAPEGLDSAPDGVVLQLGTDGAVLQRGAVIRCRVVDGMGRCSGGAGGGVGAGLK